MRKIIILLFVFICCLTSCSNQSIATDKTEKANSPEPVCNATYQLFPTQNMWTFIKLNTRDGRMWQVQYDIKGSERFEVNLNTAPFATKEEERDGRFTLYPTQNMWTFILLDQIDGRMWQIGNQIIPQSYSDRELYSLQCGEGKQEDRWKNC